MIEKTMDSKSGHQFPYPAFLPIIWLGYSLTLTALFINRPNNGCSVPHLPPFLWFFQSFFPITGWRYGKDKQMVKNKSRFPPFFAREGRKPRKNIPTLPHGPTTFMPEGSKCQHCSIFPVLKMNRFTSELLNVPAVVTPSCLWPFCWADFLNHSRLLPARDWVLNKWNCSRSQISAIRLRFDQSLLSFPKDELTS